MDAFFAIRAPRFPDLLPRKEFSRFWLHAGRDFQRSRWGIGIDLNVRDPACTGSPLPEASQTGFVWSAELA